MSSRTRANAERRRNKKIENQLNFGHSAARSETLIETCMQEIVRVTREAVELKDRLKPIVPVDILEELIREDDDYPEEKYAELKGRVNGLVWMYCKVWVNPYEPHLSAAVKSVRREAVKRARAQMAQESAG